MKAFEWLLVCIIISLSTVLLIVTKFKAPKEFNGILVCKEYIPQHMSNEPEKPIYYAGHFPIIVPQAKPQLIESKFYWYAANKDEIKRFDVDSVMFHTLKIGDPIKF